MEDTREYLIVTQRVLQELSVEKIEEIVEVLWAAYRQDRTIFVIGNGGSAATASHFACDLEKGTILPGRKRFKVMDLVSNIPLLTAWANDTDYANVFAKRLENYVQTGDVLIAISGSGNSANILSAVKIAKVHGAVTVGLTGFKGGKLNGLADHCLVVPSDNMQHIEDVHMTLAHLIFVQLRNLLGEEGRPASSARARQDE